MSEVRVRLVAWRMSGHPMQVHHLLSVHTCEMNERPLPEEGTTLLDDRKWVVSAERLLGGSEPDPGR